MRGPPAGRVAIVKPDEPDTTPRIVAVAIRVSSITTVPCGVRLSAVRLIRTS
jgi:hypothetical protein